MKNKEQRILVNFIVEKEDKEKMDIISKRNHINVSALLRDKYLEVIQDIKRMEETKC